MNHDENAETVCCRKDEIKRLKGDNKELYIVEDASHVDFYDNQAGVIPYDKMVTYFNNNLK